MAKTCFVRVALDNPLPVLFDYLYDPARLRGVDDHDMAGADRVPEPGELVVVPFGSRRVVGMIWDVAAQSDVPAARIKPVEQHCTTCAPLDARWRALVDFASAYYQRGTGEVALPALPQGLRDPAQWPRLRRTVAHYRVLPDAAALLDAAVPARAPAVRRLVGALLTTPLLRADAARRLHPRAQAFLDEWLAAGWLDRVDRSVSLDDIGTPEQAVTTPWTLGEEQQAALEAIDAASLAGTFAPFLLHGITGSGKTEVYLQVLERLLARDPQAQALVLVPEINLTPQFDALFRRRFAHLGTGALVTLHSGLAEGERLRHWLAAHNGSARIVLGTRLAVLASFQRLSMLIVDEEHEAAYKQQEGLRYSARDLAVWRAKQLDVPIVLGSATPALESWWQAEQGRYRLLPMKTRPQRQNRPPPPSPPPPGSGAPADGEAPLPALPMASAEVTPAVSAPPALPRILLVDMEVERQRKRQVIDGFGVPLVSALRERLARGEQSLIFLNRRGYAPVLGCDSCGWMSGCPRCSAYLVLHKLDRVLRCHHCGWQERIPHACPECGNVDIAPIGRGTQRAEETLATLVPGARVLRIDADSTRKKGSAAALFANVHAGDVDILVGTHMIAKGHDFQNVTLVGVLNADAALFSHDFRATERLFAQLMQVAGRAGRAGQAADVMIQTRHPSHPLYAALARQDYDGFARAALEERRQAGLPPFVYQALLRAEARSLEQVMAFLQRAAVLFDETVAALSAQAGLSASGAPSASAALTSVHRFDPVPMALVKIANTFRAQLLIESPSRAALQRVLPAWQHALRGQRGGVLRWAVEIDPLDI